MKNLILSLFTLSAASNAFATVTAPYYDCKVLGAEHSEMRIGIADLRVEYFNAQIHPSSDETLFTDRSLLGTPTLLRRCKSFENNFQQLGQNWNFRTKFDMEFTCDGTIAPTVASIHLRPGSMGFKDEVEGQFSLDSQVLKGSHRHLATYLVGCRLILNE